MPSGATRAPTASRGYAGRRPPTTRVWSALRLPYPHLAVPLVACAVLALGNRLPARYKRRLR